MEPVYTGLKQSVAHHPRRWAWGLLAPLAVGILLICTPAALAALQLNYFNVISFPTSVTLEWSTASEVNLAGFDVQCKLANEPDSAFHEIGYVRAKGGPDVGALYSFQITSNIVPGASYCFRLKEITTDGSPGEVIDRCGYGPMVTPTPGTGAVPVFTPIPVPTDQFGNPIIPPTPTPPPPAVPTDAFGNPIPPTAAVPTDAFGNPIPPTPTLFTAPAVPTDAFGSPLPIPQPVATDAFGNPLPPTVPPAVPTDAFGSPLPLPPPVATDAFGNPIPPTPTVPGPINPSGIDASSVAPAAVATDAFGNPLAAPVMPREIPTDAFGNPLQEPLPGDLQNSAAGIVAVPTDAFGNPLATVPTDAFGNPLTADPALTDAFGSPLAAPLLDSGANLAAAAAPAVPVSAATPTPEFIIVTATPTSAPVALAPVLTPLPTATPAGVQLASALDPGQNLTQNLMIMLLCLTFTGASGIGIVGLITSVMFMRSRSSQREFYERTSVRRRF